MRVHPLRFVLFSFFSFLFLVGSSFLTAQQITDAQGDVGFGTLHPHPSALVELASHTKGILLPRMTTAQRNRISAPAEGLIMFNTTLGRYQFWNGDALRWETLLTTADSVAGVVSVPSEPMGGDAWLFEGNTGLIPWNGAAGNFIGHTDNTPLVLKTENAGIEFWTGNTGRGVIDREGNFRPATDSIYTMGTDAHRWGKTYVSETGVHIGPAGGEAGNGELRLSYAAGTASLNVDGGEAEVAVTTERTVIRNNLLVGGNLIARDGHLHSVQSTGPTLGVVGPHVTSAILSNGTDVAGLLTITTSSFPLHGPQATVTFNAPYLLPPVVTLTPADNISPGVGAYITRTTTGFTVGFMGIPASSTSYHFFYQVIEAE